MRLWVWPGTRISLDGMTIVVEEGRTLQISSEGQGATIDGAGSSRIAQVKDGSRLQLHAISLKNGKASASDGGNGGAVLLSDSGSTLSMSGGAIEDCGTSDTSGDGGAVHASNGSSVVLRDVNIANCLARKGHGGALFAVEANLTLTDTSISGCQSDVTTKPVGDRKHGGGVFAYASAVKMTRGAITGCRGNDGGGFYFAGATTGFFSRTMISQCDAKDQGGGGHVTGRSRLICQGCQITSSSGRASGGLHINDKSEVGLLNGSIVSDSQSKTTGGCVGVSYTSSLRVMNSALRRCQARKPNKSSWASSITNGGCIMVQFGSSATIVSSVLQDGEAEYGGCISQLSSGSLTTIVDSRLEDCVASDEGGAMQLRESTVRMSRSSVTTASAASGGVMHASISSYVELSQCTISRTSAAQVRRALCLCLSTFSF